MGWGALLIVSGVLRRGFPKASLTYRTMACAQIQTPLSTHLTLPHAPAPSMSQAEGSTAWLAAEKDNIWTGLHIGYLLFHCTRTPSARKLHNYINKAVRCGCTEAICNDTIALRDSLVPCKQVYDGLPNPQVQRFVRRLQDQFAAMGDSFASAFSISTAEFAELGFGQETLTMYRFLHALDNILMRTARWLDNVQLQPANFMSQVEYRPLVVKALERYDAGMVSLVDEEASVTGPILAAWGPQLPPEVLNPLKGLFGHLKYRPLDTLRTVMGHLEPEERVGRRLYAACNPTTCVTVKREGVVSAILKGLGTVSLITTAAGLLASVVYRVLWVQPRFEIMEDATALTGSKGPACPRNSAADPECAADDYSVLSFRML